MVRNRRVRSGTRLHVPEPGPHLDRERDAAEQRPDRGHQRAGVQEPASGPRSGRRLRPPTASPNNFAKTRNGGATWDLLTGAPAEYRSGATWLNGNTALAVGLSGSDFSRNGGRTWTRFDDGSLDTVDCANPNACWAAGANGRVAYLTR